MNKAKRQKQSIPLTRAERRARYRKQLNAQMAYSSEKTKPSYFVSSVTGERMEMLKSLLEAVGSVLSISPTGRVELPVRSVNDRLKRSWDRTGMAIHQAIDEYGRVNQIQNTQHSEAEIVHAALK